MTDTADGGTPEQIAAYEADTDRRWAAALRTDAAKELAAHKTVRDDALDVELTAEEIAKVNASLKRSREMVADLNDMFADNEAEPTGKAAYQQYGEPDHEGERG